jgi:hypothetical protein
MSNRLYQDAVEENERLRAEIKKLKALLKSASHHVETEGDSSLLFDILNVLED